MTRYVDRQAGFATFVQGRSLCVRLDGTLDEAMARGVADQIRNDHTSIRLRLECSSLRVIHPEAASTLARALLAWSHGRPDRSIDILNLDPALQARVAWHPLRALLDPDELVFIDPDRETAWGSTPSRH